MTIDPDTENLLRQLELDINVGIDNLIVKRQNIHSDDRAVYRYVTNKLQLALTAVNKALDRVEYNTVEFKLDENNKNKH